jgi:hypothetical protein
MNEQPDYSEEYRQAVLRARAMSPEEKLLEGSRLFEEECEQMRSAIREAMPELSDEMVGWELRSRFDKQREEEGRGLYVKMPIGWKPAP